MMCPSHWPISDARQGGFRNLYLSRHPLLELLYSSIVSAIGNVVDFMVGTSELVDIALGYAALLKSKNCKPSSMR